MRTAIAWILAAGPVGWALLRFAAPDDSTRVIALQGFTPYATGGAIAALILILLLRRWLPSLVAAAAILALVSVVVPRAVGNRDARAGGDRLTVLTNNTRFGGVSTRALLALARRSGADVVSLQELTPELADALESSAFGRRYPHRVLRADVGAGGTGLYSRTPLRALASPDAPGHLMTAARLRMPGGPTVDLVSVHPVAPTSPGETARWRLGLGALPAASPDGRLRILAGDFNATLDHARLRAVVATGYADAAERSGKGLIPTWPERKRRLPPLLTIDHVLVDERIRLRDVSVEALPGTDHRAVVAHLVL